MTTITTRLVVGKVGLVDKKWADRLMIGLTYSRMYKEIQTGVVQKVVFGENIVRETL